MEHRILKAKPQLWAVWLQSTPHSFWKSLFIRLEHHFQDPKKSKRKTENSIAPSKIQTSTHLMPCATYALQSNQIFEPPHPIEDGDS